MNKKIIYIILIVIFVLGLIFLNVFMENKNVEKDEKNNEVKNEIVSLEDEEVLEVTSSNFEIEVLESEKTVLVDFYASWCRPCKMYSPIVKEFAKENKDIKVVKIDMDNEEELANKYKIMSIPTTVVIKDGKIINKAVGVLNKEQIKELIK